MAYFEGAHPSLRFSDFVHDEKIPSPHPPEGRWTGGMGGGEEWVEVGGRRGSSVAPGEQRQEVLLMASGGTEPGGD